MVAPKLPTREEIDKATDEELSTWAAKYLMEGRKPKKMSVAYDYRVLRKVGECFDGRWLQVFFDALHMRLGKRGRYTNHYQQDIRFMIDYVPGDYAYAALCIQIQRIEEAKKIQRGENPYPVGERYPIPPPIPGLKVARNEKICRVCNGSGRSQLNDLTIEVCLLCMGEGKYKKEVQAKTKGVKI